MKRCSEFAYAMCPYRRICGPQQDAVYMEGSECAKFNEDHQIGYNNTILPPCPGEKRGHLFSAGGGING